MSSCDGAKNAGKRKGTYLESAADGGHRFSHSLGYVGEVVAGLRVVVVVQAVGAEGAEKRRLAG